MECLEIRKLWVIDKKFKRKLKVSKFNLLQKKNGKLSLWLSLQLHSQQLLVSLFSLFLQKKICLFLRNLVSSWIFLVILYNSFVLLLFVKKSGSWLIFFFFNCRCNHNVASMKEYELSIPYFLFVYFIIHAFHMKNMNRD